MSFPRSAGILLHPPSLASSGGVGDCGSAAYRFVDFLAAARQGLWQVLPLGPLGFGNSPYSSTSAFAGNPLLISLERLAEHGWIDRAKIDSANLADARIADAKIDETTTHEATIDGAKPDPAKPVSSSADSSPV